MVFKLMPYTISYFSSSDVGLVRQNNEDYFGEIPSLNFFAIADGMGGHRGGEVASKETIKALIDILNKTIGSNEIALDLPEMHGILHFAIEHANDIIYKMSLKNKELRGMGTTLCCLLFSPQGVVFAHVGDSRIYRLRNKKLEQLTKDHSLLRQLRDEGKIDDDSSNDYLYKGIITKAIGTGKMVDPSVHTSDISDQDWYLMCTDGLSDMMAIEEVEKILNDHTDLESATSALIGKAKEKGGFDNITIVLTKVEHVS